MKTKNITSSLLAAFVLSGCANINTVTPMSNDNIQKEEKLSTLLVRLKNKNHESYALSSGDISFPISESDKISNFDELRLYLAEKGYVVDIISNKYRVDKPKIIEIFEKGRYAGALSVVPYTPIKDGTFTQVLSDVGLTIKYTVVMDADVISESAHLQKPDTLFAGKTVADYLLFCEKVYDYAVEIDTQKASIEVKKYKSEVIPVPADKAKITADSMIFLGNDKADRKVKEFVADNGKVFITGTPSTIEKAKKYASEMKIINNNRVIVVFDGESSVAEALLKIGKGNGASWKLGEGDFIPEKDKGSWVENDKEVDEYLRKNYNKKLVKKSELDANRDGIADVVVFDVKKIQGISLAVPTTISKFFKSLGEIDGKEYIVDGDDNIPITKLIIDDFDHLAAYLWVSVGKKITYTDPGEGLPKIIRVEN